MNIGMLWFDNTGDQCAEKVRRAAKYYREKYGRTANCAYVSLDQHDIDAVDGMRVKPSRSVLKNHIWIGVEDE